jgi:hypothetical protein
LQGVYCPGVSLRMDAGCILNERREKKDKYLLRFSSFCQTLQGRAAIRRVYSHQTTRHGRIILKRVMVEMETATEKDKRV